MNKQQIQQAFNTFKNKQKAERGPFPFTSELEAFKAGIAAAQLAAPVAAQEPAGYKLVPIKPDDVMIDAALEAHEPLDGDEFDYRAEFKRTYRAMINAAPAADGAPQGAGQ